MIADVEIYRAANTLFEQHGDDAPTHAAMMADRMIECGDLYGLATWKRIIKAIDELRSQGTPDKSALLN